MRRKASPGSLDGSGRAGNGDAGRGFDAVEDGREDEAGVVERLPVDQERQHREEVGGVVRRVLEGPVMGDIADDVGGRLGEGPADDVELRVVAFDGAGFVVPDDAAGFAPDHPVGEHDGVLGHLWIVAHEDADRKVGHAWVVAEQFAQHLLAVAVGEEDLVGDGDEFLLVLEAEILVDIFVALSPGAGVVLEFADLVAAGAEGGDEAGAEGDGVLDFAGGAGDGVR